VFLENLPWLAFCRGVFLENLPWLAFCRGVFLENLPWSRGTVPLDRSLFHKSL